MFNLTFRAFTLILGVLAFLIAVVVFFTYELVFDNDVENYMYPHKMTDIPRHFPTKNPNMTYILIWSAAYKEPMASLKTEQKAFLDRKCKSNNCLVYDSPTYLSDLTEFDIILFYYPALYSQKDIIPFRRFPRQKYVFASLEAPVHNPICQAQYYNFFNLTWTYKLDSDIVHPNLIVRDLNGNVIGPKKEMHWKESDVIMKTQINPNTSIILSAKTKFAAWIDQVNPITNETQRGSYMEQLQEELRAYNVQVDIYGFPANGNCQPLDCRRMLKENYHYLIAFEKDFSDDYVSKDLLIALQEFTIPVVYGGANYTRFMPDGIYLDAMKLNPKQLAKEMNEIVNNTEKYHSFFKFRNFYWYTDPVARSDTDPYCQLCNLGNAENRFAETPAHGNLEEWWNGEDDVKCP